MGEAVGLVPAAIILSALVILLRLNEAHKVRRGFFVILVATPLAISLGHPNFLVAAFFLFLGSILSLGPIAMLAQDEGKELKLQTLISFQSISMLFLVFAIFWLDAFITRTSVFVLIAISSFFRLALPFSSRSLTDTLIPLPPSQRSLFYLSATVYGIFITTRVMPKLVTQGVEIGFAIAFVIPLAISMANSIWAENRRERFLFLAHIFVLIPLILLSLNVASTTLTIISAISLITVAVFAQTNSGTQPVVFSSKKFSHSLRALTQLDVLLFRALHVAALSGSRFSRRFVGPVFSEWILIRAPGGAFVIIRLLSRFISFVSFPRLIATSIAISVLMLVYVLRL